MREFIVYLIEKIFRFLNKFFDERAALLLAEIILTSTGLGIMTVLMSAVPVAFLLRSSDYSASMVFILIIIIGGSILGLFEWIKEIPAEDRSHLLRQIFRKER